MKVKNYFENMPLSSSVYIKSLKNKKSSSIYSPFEILVALIWIKDIILSYVKGAMLKIPIINNIAEFLIPVLISLFVILSIPEFLKKIKLSDFIFYLTVILICIVNFFIFPENQNVLLKIVPGFLLFIVPMYFIGTTIDLNKIYKLLYWLSVFTIFARLLYSVTLEKSMSEVESLYTGDMMASYQLLPHVCAVILSLFNKPNFINIISSAIGVIFIFSLGSRGPLVCFAVFVIFYLLFFKKYKKPMLVYTSIITAGGVLFLFFDRLLILLYNISLKLGLSIRIFAKFFEGDFFVSSSRNRIIEVLFEKISEKPVLGYGIAGDRTLVGGYSHNLAVELWVSFGIIIGTILLGVLFFICIKALIKSRKNNVDNMAILLLICCGLINLFLSGSYLSAPYLFLLIGLCISVIRKSKNKTDAFLKGD